MDVLIVEDEYEVLTGMKSMLETRVAGIDGVYALGNAEDALDLIAAKRPPLIVTDIVLPQMSGIELMERLRANMPDYRPKLVVISSHSHFEYARRSLQAGAIDYILKPFDRDEVARKLQSIVQLIAEEARLQSRLRNRLEHAEVGTKAMKDKFVLGLCTHKSQLLEHVYHRLQLWELTWIGTMPYAVAAFAPSEPPASEEEAALRHFAVGNVAADTLAAYSCSYLVSDARLIWIVIAECKQLEAIVRDIRSNTLTYQKIDIAFGASATTYSVQALAGAYRQAQRALKVALFNKLAVAYADDEALDPQGRPAAQTEASVAGLIYAGDDERLRPAIGACIDRHMLAPGVANVRQLAQVCLEWMLQVHNALEQTYGVKHDISFLAVWEALEKAALPDELKEAVERHFVALSRSIADQKSSINHFLIEKAKRHIAAHFRRNLTLQDVADELYIHPVWFSHLFKKVTGQNFLDYTTEMRMEEAKKQLRESSKKIYEIADEVGYQDLQHFGKVFKKRVGVTPKQFRYGK
ncbi:response regulator [Paenibacillus cymbidii]|uniref:response regulator n=1 Tax=Paenibacillus cymbidii TaxID=1639034 RepID=UPI001081D1C9|nr:response regulator [Paenibacillus cymbidii]